MYRTAPGAPPATDGGPLVGTCISGDFRALDHTYPSIQEHVTRAFGGAHVHFLYIEAPNDCAANATRCRRAIGGHSRRQGLGPYANRILTGSWASVNDSCVVRTSTALSDHVNIFYGHPPAHQFCFRGVGGFYRHEAAEQFAKVRLSFRMLIDYERRWQVTFDWVLRLRTDMLLLAPLAHHTTLPEGAHLVRGLVAAEVNDHTVLISRKFAPAYFDLVDEIGCENRSDALPDDQRLIVNRLMMRSVPMWNLLMPYVLVRPGVASGSFHYDCWRFLFMPGIAPGKSLHTSGVVTLTSLGNPIPWNMTGPVAARTSESYERYFKGCCMRYDPTFKSCVALGYTNATAN